jgi:hypothetical protein
VSTENLLPWSGFASGPGGGLLDETISHTLCTGMVFLQYVSVHVPGGGHCSEMSFDTILWDKVVGSLESCT